jgi:hypothetical protein
MILKEISAIVDTKKGVDINENNATIYLVIVYII